MIDRKIAVCDKQNFRKKLSEFMRVAREYNFDEFNDEKAKEVLLDLELLRNSLYKYVSLKRPALPEDVELGTEEGISRYESDYSNEILKVKIYELLPSVKTPANNKRLERTCQIIGNKHSGLFLGKSVMIRVQVCVPRKNWDIDNRDLRYILNGFIYGKLISDDNIELVSCMMEGICGDESFIKIFVAEKDNLKKICEIKPKEWF
ncbi:MAG: hypothetical protein IKD76_05850 [Clostridia bacterium]|nr:hypothetical protein [Clostridia bacterium]